MRRGGDACSGTILLDLINNYTFKQGVWHDFRIEAAGNSVTVSVDGVLLLSANDDAITRSGYVNLLAKPGALTWYDDVRVVELLPAGVVVAEPATPRARNVSYVEGGVLFEDDFDIGFVRNWNSLAPNMSVAPDGDRTVLLAIGNETDDGSNIARSEIGDTTNCRFSAFPETLTQTS